MEPCEDIPSKAQSSVLNASSLMRKMTKVYENNIIIMVTMMILETLVMMNGNLWNLLQP